MLLQKRRRGWFCGREEFGILNAVFSMRNSAIVVLMVIAGFCISRPDPTRKAGPMKLNQLSKLPVYFVENRGQVDGRVRYFVDGRNTSVYFSPGAVTYSLRKPAARKKSGLFQTASLPSKPALRWNVRLEFVNANPNMRMEAGAPATARMNYFRGRPQEWHTDIGTYRSVTYREVWPGIDVEFAGPDGNLKYTFVVHAGADPGQIRMRYEGAEKVALAGDGSLMIETTAGSFADDKPVAWQDGGGATRDDVGVAFCLRDGEVTFEVAGYDRSRTLAIDPVIYLYAGHIGGTTYDEGYGMAVDANGAVYVTGQTGGGDFNAVVGPDRTENGSFDAFITKVNPEGTDVVYSGVIGGYLTDYGMSVAVDSMGSAYVLGGTTSSESTNFPVVVGPSLTRGIYDDVFVAKVSPTGSSLLYCGFIGGDGGELPGGIAVDSLGNAYVSGTTFSNAATFPVKQGPKLTPGGGNRLDGFVAKVNPSGSGLVYAGFVGNEQTEAARGIAVDPDGNAYVMGYTSTFPGEPNSLFDSAFRFGSLGQTDIFVQKVSPAGSLVYTAVIGGDGIDTFPDAATPIAVDAKGNAYVIGKTDSSVASFPLRVGPRLQYGPLAGEVFILKLNPSGDDFVYSGYIGSGGYPYAVAVDSVGNAYATMSAPNGLPVIEAPGLASWIFSGDYTIKIDSRGAKTIFAGYVGGRGVAVDPPGNTYVITNVSGTSWAAPILSAPKMTFKGHYDVRVTKLSAFTSTAGPTVAFRDGSGNLMINTLPGTAFRNAGGVFASDPAIAISAAGRAFFVARDTAQPTIGGLYLNTLLPDETYAGWKFLGATVQGTPAITTVGETAYVAARDGWGAYWATTYTHGGTPQPWTFLGGVLSTDPSIAACADGSVYVAGREPYGAIWTRRYDATSSTWRNWTGAGGVTQGKPSVACGSDNAAYISTRDPWNAMWLARVTGETFSGWTAGGGILNDDPQIVANGTNVHVFALSYSVPHYRTWQVGSGWQNWTPIGGVLTHMSPAVYGGNLYITGQSSTGEVFWWNGLNNTWTNLGNRNVAASARFGAAYR